jgi:nucleobase:cation symporter-1, NCS1 family
VCSPRGGHGPGWQVAFPILAAVFLVGLALILAQVRTDTGGSPVPGAVLIVAGTAFGQSGGGAPAPRTTPATRPDQARRAGLSAAVGLFTSVTLLQVTGAAAVTAVGAAVWNDADPVASYVSLLPG